MPTHSTVRNAATLGALVFQARTHAGISQQHLAERLGVSKQLVWDVENGRSTKAVDRLFALLRELDVTLTATVPDPASEEDDT